MGMIVPAPVPPLPTCRAPVTVAPVATSRGTDPSIPLAVLVPSVASPLDLMGQMLLLQELAAARGEYSTPACVASAIFFGVTRVMTDIRRAELAAMGDWRRSGLCDQSCRSDGWHLGPSSDTAYITH